MSGRARRRLRRCSSLAAAAALFAGCELTEVTLATPADVILAELVLRAGASDTVQHAYLHRTAGESGNARVYGAVITVRDETAGTSVTFEVVEDDRCLTPDSARSVASIGTCYGARLVVQPGRSYALRIEAEGRVMTGRTQVPDSFRLVRPGPAGLQPRPDVAACALAPGRSLELLWSQAPGAWVYITDAQLTGLRQALRNNGVNVPGTAPISLNGLTVSGADTTFQFPGGLGLFNRADTELHTILLAIRDGLPPNVDVDLAIGAADRNYVNWVRGGTFNPSGQVRVPSIQGGGTGVFGALVVRSVAITTRPQSAAPPCE